MIWKVFEEGVPILTNIGSDSIFHAVSVQRIMGVYSLKGAGVQRARKVFKDKKLLLDLRFGAKARSLILLDDGTAILSPHSSKLLVEKINMTPLGVIPVGRKRREEPAANDGNGSAPRTV